MSDLKQFIAKRIQYDCSQGNTCPKCKHEFGQSYWLYNQWTLAHEIAKELGFGDKIGDLISDSLDGFHATGKKTEDAEEILKILQHQILPDLKVIK